MNQKPRTPSAPETKAVDAREVLGKDRNGKEVRSGDVLAYFRNKDDRFIVDKFRDGIFWSFGRTQSLYAEHAELVPPSLLPAPVPPPVESEPRKMARARVTPEQAREELMAWLAPIAEVFKPFPRAVVIGERTNDGKHYALAEFPGTVVKGRIWNVSEARERVRQWVQELGDREVRR